MRKLFYLLLLLVFACEAPQETTQRTAEQQRWEAQAENVTIIRDTYGIPHIYGKTDADAVFGMIYSQCEDDFNRVETNLINGMGRLAETEGESAVYRDLRMKLFVNPDDFKKKYDESPEWLKMLMNAHADGINYFLYKHPEVKPKVIQKFEPWMALTFSEGSIGTDIEQNNIGDLKDLYGTQVGDMAIHTEEIPEWKKPDTGSNGFSIAPKLTGNGKTLFVINPHTSFFFRSEVHINSEEGLNAYGAVTWGQFFIYQGFNERLGWMHTSTKADAIDEYAETIIEKEGKFFYKYGEEERKVITKTITVPYKTGAGMEEKTFTAYYTHHGPIIRKEEDGKWIAVKLMERPIDALTQSYNRMKATTFEAFDKVMQIRTNSSNNTVYADADGKIAYYHGNFMPKRDAQFDFSKPVDGSNPATEWDGLHEVSEMVRVIDPENGWIQNCNATPFTAAGEFSPKKEDYPTYMAPDLENYRGLHAVALFKEWDDFTLDGMIKFAYDPYITGFDYLFPPLFKAYDGASAADKTELKEAIDLLKGWDKKSSKESVETSLAVFWAQNLRSASYQAEDRNGMNVYQYMEEKASAEMHIAALKETIKTLMEDFGSIRVPHGDVNRYQRINGDIRQDFNDDKPSTAIGFSSSRWGALASFGARKYPGTKKMYGTNGNSFVAFVEFGGDTLIAKSITAGGLSSDPNNPHFDDQLALYKEGKFKDVLFYKNDVEADAKSTYMPGGEVK